MRTTGLLVALAGVALVGCEAPVQPPGEGPADQSFTGYARRGIDVPPETSAGPSISLSSQSIALSSSSTVLTFFTDRTAFQAAVPGLPVEDWEGSNVPANSVQSCAGPFNSATNNACYSTGAILDGISAEAIGAGEMVVLTTGFLGVSSTVVGPNFFADDTDIKFPNNNVSAVGMDLLDPFGPATLDVEIFGPGDVSLGTTSVTTGTSSGVFWGVASDSVITSIRFDQTAGGGGELFDDVAFGGTAGALLSAAHDTRAAVDKDFGCYVPHVGLAAKSHATVSASGNQQLTCRATTTSPPADHGSFQADAFVCKMRFDDGAGADVFATDSKLVITPLPESAAGEAQATLTCHYKK
ncbi:MAG: hypothetical protein GTO22_07190 [Gemmatimonadales bacterium]|nr:hypothetical protein [Gemmatimonadales bacterium]